MPYFLSTSFSLELNSLANSHSSSFSSLSTCARPLGLADNDDNRQTIFLCTKTIAEPLELSYLLGIAVGCLAALLILMCWCIYAIRSKKCCFKSKFTSCRERTTVAKDQLNIAQCSRLSWRIYEKMELILCSFLSLLCVRVFIISPQIVTTIKLLRKIGEFEFLLNAWLLHTSSVAKCLENVKEISSIFYCCLPLLRWIFSPLTSHISRAINRKRLIRCNLVEMMRRRSVSIFIFFSPSAVSLGRMRQMETWYPHKCIRFSWNGCLFMTLAQT